MLIGLLAGAITELAGVLALIAAGIAGIYLYWRTPRIAFLYWTMFVFTLTLVVFAILYALNDPANLMLQAVTSPAPDPRGPVRPVEMWLNVLVPYALVFFFSAPFIAKYFPRRSE